jgi:hypothetical protein
LSATLALRAKTENRNAFGIFFMLQRFIEWMDSWGDHINPLVVREVRRMFRNPSNIWLPCLYYVFVIILCLVSWFVDSLSCSTIFLVSSVGICYCGAVCGLVWANSIDSLSVVDEMFRMNTLSLRQNLHANIAILIITSLFYISFAFLPLSVVQIIGSVQLTNFMWSNVHFVYIFPLLAFLIGQTINLYCLSLDVHIPQRLKVRFSPKDRTILEQIKVMLLMIVFFLMGGSLMVPFVAVALLWTEIFQLQPFSIYDKFDLFSIYFFLPIILTVMSLTAYSLCVKGLRINRKIRFSGIFYNFVIYSILHICLVAIYFILIFFFR